MAENPFPGYVLKSAREVGLNYEYFETVPSSIYSSLMPLQYHRVKDVFIEFIPNIEKIKKIVDGTSNIGCDTVLFKDIFQTSKIDSIEIDLDTFKCLKKNIKKSNIEHILGRELPSTGRVKAYHMSIIDYLNPPDGKYPKADFIYFDPPWGGPDYYKKEKLMLKLDDVNIGIIIGKALINNTKIAVLKAPVNFDLYKYRVDLKDVLGYKPKVSSYSIEKPRGNKKGNISYILHFIKI
jgi:hypothetical protein